ncbi:MAG: hypothetical protein ABSH46_18680 [Bryobacteraceae bacterium]|jgi:hypothetical protein
MAAPKQYKLYAALHEDIAQGFVWLKYPDLPARCIVKLTYNSNGHRRAVFCEALQFDKNFLRRYNEQLRCTIKDDESSLASSMVINHWYRARLGRPGAPLETKREYPLEVKAYDRWYNTWYGKLRACMGHPQIVVRVAVCMALLSAALGSLSFLGVTIFRSVAVSELIRDVIQFVRPADRITTTPPAFSVDEALALRGAYGDLLGKPREAVIERFGTPQTEDGRTLGWGEAPRTGNRSLLVIFDSANKGSLAQGVKVGARSTERLDVTEVLQKAPMFTFDTGTYTDTLLNYFTASTKDGRNAFQFDVTERGARFRYVIFTSK